MPVCPKCGKEIDHLTGFTQVWHEYKLSVDEKGNERYESTDSILDGNDDDEFDCPECAMLLFKGEEKAKKFLKGELNE